ncbi:TraB/GumN family protein [Enterobacillus tribolii]|uniref:Conjugal transfer protein TraB n=1 Tax=Enterobacillus tribolii TaxID=1487935 RepID=A0A370QSA8_9GAMM|nr:TraB/GumN family protein [Enterobacillus tribolii]MBW7983773.1 conjugal transfer protein TraB [Enterobacillus tribolii]RDK92138.1 hypothetical protein C8D90_104296 [Enterobacillus tribolii]
MLKHLRRLGALLGFIPAKAPAYPAIDLALPRGPRLHLVGSIHMGSPEMAPLPAALTERLSRADALIVEADITCAASPFEMTQDAVSLREVLNDDEWEQLCQRGAETGIAPENIDGFAPWRAALMLQAQQAHQLGLRPDYGIDYQMLRQAHQQGLKIIELEGAATQMALLENLPEGGIALLRDTLTHWHTNARLLQTMLGWWLSPGAEQEKIALPATFSAGLYQILMEHRNQQWRDILCALPQGNYVVAVGALHLFGTDNLPELLLNQGAG